MKKIGIILAALVILMFFVGAVAAMHAVNPPDQREKFREDCAVQGVGLIEYEKTILDKSIAVDVYEHMIGNGSFAMTITEILNEGVRLNCSGNCTAMGTITDPIFGDEYSPVMTNFECKKMVQFDQAGNPDNALSGYASYSSPGFQGGLNAKVIEDYHVAELQKDERITMTTTATYNDTGRTHDDWTDCGKYKPFTSNELNYDSQNAFVGRWGTHSTWKKVCSKDIEHFQQFTGEFQVDKNLLFREEVTKPCRDKIDDGGDC